jgi:hypothetical protein
MVYAVISGIPEKFINLDTWRSKKGLSAARRSNLEMNSEKMREHACGTLGCAVGWVSAHPWFNEQGLTATERGSPKFEESDGLDTSWFAVNEFFGITHEVACTLFEDAPDNLSQSRAKPRERISLMPFTNEEGRVISDCVLSDKKRVLRRVRRYLMSCGYITTKRNAELALEDGAPA